MRLPPAGQYSGKSALQANYFLVELSRMTHFFIGIAGCETNHNDCELYEFHSSALNSNDS
jgi:hypothetical protein